MAHGGEAIHVVQRQRHRHGKYRCKQRRPQRPPLTRANPTPRQGDHSDPESNHQTRHGSLEMTDIVVQVWAECADLFGRAADVCWCEAEFDEAGEVADKEDEPVTDQSKAGQRDKTCPEGRRGWRGYGTRW